jgi:hypothetical protein
MVYNGSNKTRPGDRQGDNEMTIDKEYFDQLPKIIGWGYLLWNSRMIYDPDRYYPFGVPQITFRKYDNPKVKTESKMWSMIRDAINNVEGINRVVKSNPVKDGHLLSAPYYLKNSQIYITDDNYTLRGLQEAYNSGELVKLTVHYRQFKNGLEFLLS